MDKRYRSGAIFLIIAVAVTAVFVDQKYREIKAVKNALYSKESELNGWQDASKKIEEVNKKFASALKDVEKIDELLPKDKNIADLFVQTDYIISRNGLVTKKISFAPAPDVQIKNGKYSIERINLELAGSYESFLNFIKDIEKNVHLMDISNFSVISANDSEEESAKSFNFKVTIDAYYK